MAGRQKGGGGIEEASKPRTLTIFSRKEIGETIRHSNGNAIAKALVEAMGEDGVEAEVVPVPASRGFRILAKKGEAYLEEGFSEDDQGLRHLGTVISMESLRLPWFRKALGRVLKMKEDEELYDALFNRKFFETPWSSHYYIALSPQGIFDEKTKEMLAAARKAVTSIRPGEEDYQRYFQKTFSDALPAGFFVPSPYAPLMLPTDPRRLKSVIERDASYKKALKAAAAAAKKIISEAEKNPEAVAKKIERIAGR